MKKKKTYIDRLVELEEKAKGRFIEHSDFNIVDFLDETEAEEYEKLFERFLTKFKCPKNNIKF